MPRFNWQRVIIAEYGSAFIWIAGLLLVTLKNAWWDRRIPVDYLLVEVLLVSLVVVSLGYIVARYLKKSGLLTTERRPVLWP